MSCKLDFYSSIIALILTRESRRDQTAMTPHSCIQKCGKVQTGVARIPNVNSPSDGGKGEEGKIRPSSVPPPLPPPHCHAFVGERASNQALLLCSAKLGESRVGPAWILCSFLHTDAHTHAQRHLQINRQADRRAGGREP